MLGVRKDLCRGCGLCVESCPQQAILLQSGLARIDHSRCNRCGLCLDVCPQGAIIELTPVSGHELQTIVTGLKDKAEDIIARIERLKEKQPQS
jgi:ferredoxin